MFRRSFLAIVSSFIPTFLFASQKQKQEKGDKDKLFHSVYKIYRRITSELNDKTVDTGRNSKRFLIQNDPYFMETTDKFSGREFRIVTMSCNRVIQLVARENSFKIYMTNDTPLATPHYESITFDENEVFNKMKYLLENAMEVLPREMSKAGVLL